MPQITSHICLYSDSCTGQNKNRFIATALLHAVVNMPNVCTIDQKFLESGHTQMECDSVHVAIEIVKKCTCVYVPSQWDTIMRMTWKKKPYTVIPLKLSDFLNTKPLAKYILPHEAVDSTGKMVNWLKIKWLQFRKSEPNIIFFKYQFNQDTFNQMKIKIPTGRRGGLSVFDYLSACYKGKTINFRAKKEGSFIFMSWWHNSFGILFILQQCSSWSESERLPSWCRCSGNWTGFRMKSA